MRKPRAPTGARGSRLLPRVAGAGRAPVASPLCLLAAGLRRLNRPAPSTSWSGARLSSLKRWSLRESRFLRLLAAGPGWASQSWKLGSYSG